MSGGLVGAVQFLTRVPIRTRGEPAGHAAVVPWFPVVGAGIGAVVGGVAVGLAELVPHAVAATVAVAVGLLITGAFHEDGLADVADAFGGGWTREQRFEILKDPRHGTYGVAALAASIVIRTIAAASIVDPAALFTAFVAAHTLARVAAVAMIAVLPPATDSGLGADLARAIRPATIVAGIMAGLAVVAVATGWWMLPLTGAALAGAAAVGVLAIRKIGGVVGDVLGAGEQVAECLVLVVAGGLALHHTIWWM